MNELSEKVQDLDVMNIESKHREFGYEFTGDDEFYKKLWENAIDDIDRNHNMELDGETIFSAGGYNHNKDWEGLCFNRDTSYCGLLALNSLFPKEMLTAIKIIRKYRRNLKWACTPFMKLEGIDGVEVYDLTHVEFLHKFHKGCAINKTDDIVWIWCTYDLLKKNHFDEWNWFYEEAKYFFDVYYEPFYDKEDGLYFGQPSFIDVGCNGYPEEFGYRTTEAFNKGVWVKASSTNSLFYKGLIIMAEVAGIVGHEEDVDKWEKRAKRLKEAIRDKMRFEDGTFCYFMHKDGHLENRREVLGTAFPVLFDIVAGEEAKNALKGYPVTTMGAPCIFPYYENEKVLHNNSMWPFVDTFLLLAQEKVSGKSFASLNMTIMANTSVEGHLYEFRNMITGGVGGAIAQLWSCCGFVNACVRAGLTNIPKEKLEIN